MRLTPWSAQNAKAPCESWQSFRTRSRFLKLWDTSLFLNSSLRLSCQGLLRRIPLTYSTQLNTGTRQLKRVSPAVYPRSINCQASRLYADQNGVAHSQFQAKLCRISPALACLLRRPTSILTPLNLLPSIPFSFPQSLQHIKFNLLINPIHSVPA